MRVQRMHALAVFLHRGGRGEGASLRRRGVPVIDTAPLTPLTVIVVEDNPVDISLIRWVLEAHRLSYALQVIENGDYAMNYVDAWAQQERRRALTIMLLDLQLPQRDGREVLERVKSIPEGADIRVVIVTSSKHPADQRETLAMGADAYFVKPYHLNEFMQLGDIIKQLTGQYNEQGDHSARNNIYHAS